MGASNPPWDEEPADDMIPYQEQPRNESNTWTNSNYRPNDQESNGRRGGYRGRGNGHQRGGPRGGGGGGFPNSRNYADRNHHQGNAGGYQGNAERYQGNNGEQRNNYQGNNGEQRNNYQGNNAGGYRPNRGPHAPRGLPRSAQRRRISRSQRRFPGIVPRRIFRSQCRPPNKRTIIFFCKTNFFFWFREEKKKQTKKQQHPIQLVIVYL